MARATANASFSSPTDSSPIQYATTSIIARAYPLTRPSRNQRFSSTTLSVIPLPSFPRKRESSNQYFLKFFDRFVEDFPDNGLITITRGPSSTPVALPQPRNLSAISSPRPVKTPISPVMSPPTCFATPAPPISSTLVSTCAMCRNCFGTNRLRLPRSIRTSAKAS